MGEVIFGRVVSGCGGAALNVLGILVITDLVPLREAATWQSGVNLAATTGRSLGGPLGGWLADTIGWRWSFLSQVPVFAIAIAMSMAWLPAARARAAPSAAEHSQDESSGLASHPQNGKAPKVTGRGLARIDFLGAIFLALTILCLLFPIQMGGSKNFPWSHPAISGLAVATLLLGGLFVLVEEKWAVEPILPMELLRQREVLLLYLVAGAQCAAQLGLMFSVPLYFQVTQRSSNAAAGGYLFPAVAGNAVGAIVGGLIVKRTGRYKSLMVGAGILSSISYLLLLLRWHGHTNIWEALYIIPGGLGTGLVQILVFVGIQATIDPSLRAPAMSCLFIVISVGATIGMAAANSVTMNVMKVKLEASLIHMGLGEAIRRQIVDRASASVNYLDQAEGQVLSAVVQAYIDGLSASHLVSLVCSGLVILGCTFVNNRQLPG
ncbi:hypothetical protein MCOR25_011170 [Pyricularia grisea]|nr:hypothetical protein MCOR25_011170 [Pyricularia grisea]